jgi:ribonuclease HI
MATVFYAVAKGLEPGLYSTWADCKKQIDGFKGAVYKKFESELEANDFISANSNKPPKKEKANTIVEIEASTFQPDYYVYTDGSCSNNGKPYAKAGIGIYFGEGDPRNVSQPVTGKQSNNTAELGAIYHLYELIESDINNGKKIGIVSDSEYAIRCCTTYGQRCAKEGWSKEMPNKELVKEIYEMYANKPNVKFIHIMAHTEKTDIHSLGNDGADRLANQAIGLESCPYAEAKTRTVKIYLAVPFENKDEVKGQGGQWDFKKKKWYIMSDNANKTQILAKFSRS